MADLTNIFNGSFYPPVETVPESPESQLCNAMRDVGIDPPSTIYMDGKIHRFKTNSKGSSGAGDKTGWYICYSDNTPAGRFGDWRAGIEVSFRADIGRKFTAAEEMAHSRRMSEAKAARDAELAKQHEVTEDVVAKIWADCTPANKDHPYLKKKGICVHGSRVTGDGRLVVPLLNKDGSLSTLQYISTDGGKLYHKGGATGGKFWSIGNAENPKTIFIAEGFATAATIHETTGSICIVAYSASNIVPVTGVMRETYGATQDIVIVADNDSSGVGMRYAEQASAKHGARIVSPPELGDANDYVANGGDLLSLLMPPKDNWLVPADDLSTQPSPIKWLIKGWIQEEALIMIHGPSGGGKTFMVLDQCLRIASGGGEWMGHKVKAGSVGYFAGEGHHGLRGRIAAWKQKHQISKLNMWVSKSGCDLNTPSGYQRVREALLSLDERPSMIVFDTLHRFLLGDENSAQDTKSMLDACAALMMEFGCTVVLVHHTGVSAETQHRARGSSAWRGALDIEISVAPGDENKPMQISQKKSKDAELTLDVYATLEKIAITGWIDEDGDQVYSAVLSPTDAPVAIKKDSKLDSHRKLFEKVWFATGTEVREEMPYISRSAFMAKLDADGWAKRTAENALKPSTTNGFVNLMEGGDVIKPFEHGWIMIDQVNASALIMMKNEK
ncbi:AAA family ATPase [Chromatium okenii]|uniref:AAA family ATPase n=1 Tax=Chromatium okenii TaxID=61644 RepID=UPI0026EB346D|nr:AAA family ATPase [Chromatium okenii]MBV5309080.1 AAA family ATPase [Chromatium okenii]